MTNYVETIDELVSELDMLKGIYEVNRELLDRQYFERREDNKDFDRKDLHTLVNKDLETKRVKTYQVIRENIDNLIGSFDSMPEEIQKDYRGFRPALNDLQNQLTLHQNDDPGLTAPYNEQAILRDAILEEAFAEPIETLSNYKQNLAKLDLTKKIGTIENQLYDLIDIHAKNRTELNQEFKKQSESNPEFKREQLDTSKQADLEENRVKTYQTLFDGIQDLNKFVETKKLGDDFDYEPLKQDITGLNNLISMRYENTASLTDSYREQAPLMDAILQAAFEKPIERLQKYKTQSN